MYGDRPDPVTAATSFVAERFPGAAAAFLGGSVLTEHRTPTSDLDVVVVLDGPPAPYRETCEQDGWIVEAFVHTRESLEQFWARDAARRVPSLIRMCAESVPLVDAAGIAAQVQAEAAARLAAGPPPVEAAELGVVALRAHRPPRRHGRVRRRGGLIFIAGGVVGQVVRSPSWSPASGRGAARASHGRWHGTTRTCSNAC